MLSDKIFNGTYKGRRVFVTGHTGFKGSWLTLWLLQLKARVAGFSAYLPSEPCNFDVLGLKDEITNYTGDIREFHVLKEAFGQFQPEVVFHLAAQPIIRRSYDDPKLTFDTNLGGTVNVLECIRRTGSVKVAVIITSDKCYKNVEWVWGYRENDMLGGNDPYSASKASAELACQSYISSFFSQENSPRICTARAGNVIGGGDWADDRIVPDCIRAFSEGKNLKLRNPKATRPWQHVLEPLSGYLWLGANLLQGNGLIIGQSFNFGHLSDVNRTVEELISEFVKIWGKGQWYVSKEGNKEKKESTFLKLNCDKALQYLNWHTILSFDETVKMTGDWYKAFYSGEKDMYNFTVDQIEEYTNLAQKRGLIWTK